MIRDLEWRDQLPLGNVTVDEAFGEDVVRQGAELQPIDLGWAAEHEPAAEGCAIVLELYARSVLEDEQREFIQGLLDALVFVDLEDAIEGLELRCAHARQHEQIQPRSSIPSREVAHQ